MFFRRKVTTAHGTGSNSFDQVTMNVAKSLSRRGFLRKLGSLGLGAGLGVTGVGTALANCGNCGMGGCQTVWCGYANGICYRDYRCLDLCNNYCERSGQSPCSGC